jgi:glycosyltransferase involved in cell wall biosynthesis
VTGPAVRVDNVLPAEERFSAAGGAIATVSRHLVSGLRARGVEVRMVSPWFAGPPAADLPYARLRYGRPRSLARKVVGRAARTLTRRGDDPYAGYRREVPIVADAPVVVVHNDPVLATQLAATGRYVVLWLHNLIVGDDGAALAALPAPVVLVAVSGYVADWTARTHGLPRDRITVVHNGVDPQAFTPDPPVPGRTEGPVRVVCHARIDPNKGQVLAARAVALLRARGLPVELTVVGSLQTFGMDDTALTTYRAELEAALAAADATVTGRVAPADIPALLQGFPVALALPTVPDPCPLAPLEAMAAGCALVAVPLGGLAELVGDAALLVDPEPAAVAEALAGLVADRDALRDRRVACREQALRCSWDAAVDLTVALLPS